MGDEVTNVAVDATPDTGGTALTDTNPKVDDNTPTDTNPKVDDNTPTDGAAAGEEGSGDNAGNEGGSDTPPDTYADFVMPEGITLDETLTSEATPIFKEIGATQEQAQKLMDIAAKQIQASSEKQLDNFNQLKNDWRDSAKKDGEFGGDKFDENVKVAQSAINKYGTSEFKQLLNDYGIGNNPEMIRFMVRVGHTLKEDVPGAPGSTPTSTGDAISILYPTSK